MRARINTTSSVEKTGDGNNNTTILVIEICGEIDTIINPEKCVMMI